MGLFRKLNRLHQRPKPRETHLIRVKGTNLYLHLVGECRNGDGVYECLEGTIPATIWDYKSGMNYLDATKDDRLELVKFIPPTDKTDTIRNSVFVRRVSDKLLARFIDLDADQNHIYDFVEDYHTARIWPRVEAQKYISQYEDGTLEIVPVTDVIRFQNS